MGGGRAGLGGLPFLVSGDSVSGSRQRPALPVVFGEPPEGPCEARGGAMLTVGKDAAGVEGMWPYGSSTRRGQIVLRITGISPDSITEIPHPLAVRRT